MATLATAPIASQREKLAAVCGQPAKADLHPQVSATELCDLAKHAIGRAHGKLETAGDVLDLSESHFGRLLNDGDLKLKQLAKLGPVTLAKLGKDLVERYGPLDDPEARAMQLIDTIDDATKELRQYFAFRKTA